MRIQQFHDFLACGATLVSLAIACRIATAEPTTQDLDKGLTEIVQPFLTTYCTGCHGQAKQEGKLDLSAYSSMAAVVKNHAAWENVLQRLEAEEMPPEKSPRQPQAHERRAVIDWIERMREDEARRHAGDPGIVLARRLSNAEFDYTIRDLTGVDIRPTKEFPVDPANEAGFDNSGESLTMSPALAKKYLAATRYVADHLVLKPQGFVFAPHPAVTETDRDKYCVARIVEFYKRQPTDLADYFLAAWKYLHRDKFGKPDATVGDFAAAGGLSEKYMSRIWIVLTEMDPSKGALSELLGHWNKLPGDSRKLDEARRGCEEMRDLVVKRRKELSAKVEKMHVEGISDGSQPFVLWRNRKLAAQRMRPSEAARAKATTRDASSALELFCGSFPDAFYVADRAPYFEPDKPGQGRLLTAGFHLMQGYFRDDQPLYELVLDKAGQRELDQLWEELNFVTDAPSRQYKDFIFFERAEPPRFAREGEFDFARSEDKDATSEAKLTKMAETYLAKARRIGASDEALAAIETYFQEISADIFAVEKARREAEPSHLTALQDFAQRAYRRPLTQSERDDLLAFYQRLREKDGLSHEEAMRDTLASVLMSPHFCYRFDLAGEGTGVQPLPDYAIASRLSYFLWSSMPDEELLAHSAAGDLHRSEVLIAQTRRMLRDNKVRGLAVEFGGNWLEFRRFQEHNSVDRERFPQFTGELRDAMFEEPVRLLLDTFQENGSVLDLADGKHTFVNPILAAHYGMPVPAGGANDWVRVDDAEKYGRGGLLPMAVFLTKNSPGLRTSPVKRGYWVVRRLLGEKIPAPPPEVPELPKDEAATGDLTLPQLLAKHREHKSCAGCHARFDSFGLVFEGFGPIGERRDKDLAGRPVENKAVFPDGSEGVALDGLRGYLKSKRQDDFLDNLCRKLLSYALGRSLLLSDKATLEKMRNSLAENDHRIGAVIETIVTSPQFRNHRGSEKTGPE